MTEEKWTKEINTDRLSEMLLNMKDAMELIEEYYKEKKGELLRLKKQQEKRERKDA